MFRVFCALPDPTPWKERERREAKQRHKTLSMPIPAVAAILAIARGREQRLHEAMASIAATAGETFDKEFVRAGFLHDPGRSKEVCHAEASKQGSFYPSCTILLCDSCLAGLRLFVNAGVCRCKQSARQRGASAGEQRRGTHPVYGMEHLELYREPSH